MPDSTKRFRSNLWLFGLIAAICLLGVSLRYCGSCAYLFYNGGGGMTHVPPQFVEFNKVTDLEIKVSVWGPPQPKSMSQRAINFVCTHRLIGEEAWQQSPMTTLSEKPEELVMGVELPAFETSEHEGIEYYITFMLDGYQNRYGRPANTPIRVPFATAKAPSGIKEEESQ